MSERARNVEIGEHITVGSDANPASSPLAIEAEDAHGGSSGTLHGFDPLLLGSDHCGCWFRRYLRVYLTGLWSLGRRLLLADHRVLANHDCKNEGCKKNSASRELEPIGTRDRSTMCRFVWRSMHACIVAIYPETFTHIGTRDFQFQLLVERTLSYLPSDFLSRAIPSACDPS
jgi:hypothetical protein